MKDNETFKEMEAVISQGILDNIVLSKVSHENAITFLEKYILSKILPDATYADLWENGELSFMWHKYGCCIAGLLFDDCGDILWNYSIKENNKPIYGRFNLKEDISSHEFITFINKHF